MDLGGDWWRRVWGWLRPDIVEFQICASIPSHSYLVNLSVCRQVSIHGILPDICDKAMSRTTSVGVGTRCKKEQSNDEKALTGYWVWKMSNVSGFSFRIVLHNVFGHLDFQILFGKLGMFSSGFLESFSFGLRHFTIVSLFEALEEWTISGLATPRRVVEVVVVARLGTDIALNVETAVPRASHLVTALFFHERSTAFVAFPDQSRRHSFLDLTSNRESVFPFVLFASFGDMRLLLT